MTTNRYKLLSVFAARVVEAHDYSTDEHGNLHFYGQLRIVDKVSGTGVQFGNAKILSIAAGQWQSVRLMKEGEE